VNTKFAILDAGYLDDQNIRELYENKISFLSRMKENRRIYKQMVDKHLGSLEIKENLVEYNGRYVYIVCDECEVVDGYKAYVYLCRDITMRGLESSKLFANAKKKDMNTSDVYDALETQGIFMLFSSRQIAKEKLLGTYYMRAQIEQIFDIAKNYTNLLPLRVQTEETFRGHLVLAFIASVVVRMLQIDLKRTGYTVESALLNLKNQKCKVFDREVLPQETIKKINDIYKMFKLKCPNSIPRKKADIFAV
jgi:transposase